MNEAHISGVCKHVSRRSSLVDDMPLPRIHPALEQLNLADPDDFLIALIAVQRPGELSSIDDNAWVRASELTARHHPLIFDRRGRRSIERATWSLLLGLADIEKIDDRDAYVAPHEWLTIFAEALQRGLINRIAFGAAVRIVMTMRRDNVWPAWYTPRQLVSCIRYASPLGMMNSAEYAVWSDLPDIVTVYRGGCADAVLPDKALEEVSSHLHWSLSHDVAVTYMRARSYQRLEDTKAGLPVILRANVPRELVFAYCNRNSEREVIIDVSRLERFPADLSRRGIHKGALI